MCGRDWSSDVCSSDLNQHMVADAHLGSPGIDVPILSFYCPKWVMIPELLQPPTANHTQLTSSMIRNLSTGLHSQETQAPRLCES